MEEPTAYFEWPVFRLHLNHFTDRVWPVAGIHWAKCIDSDALLVSIMTATQVVQTGRLWFLRDDLSVFPNVERRAIHACHFLRVFGGAT
jgi:hypothetical protein